MTIRTVRGQILESFQDIQGALAILFVRGTFLELTLPSLPASALFVPLAGSQLRVQSSASHQSVSLKADELAILPQASALTVLSKTPTCEFLSFWPTAELIKNMGNMYHIPEDKSSEVFGKMGRAGQSTWIREIAMRYLYERFICKKRDNVNTQFLEIELVKEFFFKFSGTSEADNGRPHAYALNGALKRAIAHMESHLQEVLNVDELAKISMTSKSTLTRLFKKEIGKSPIEFLWTLRLEQARKLLGSGKFSVGEASELVGFLNASAFSKSFKKVYGQSPKAFLASLSGLFQENSNE